MPDCGECYEDVTFYTTIVACSFSLIGCFFVFFLTCVSKIFEEFTSRILIMISLNDFISTISQLLALLDSSAFLCKMIGFLFNLSFVSNVLWAFYICFSVFQVLIQKYDRRQHIHRIWLFYVCAVTPAVLSLPFITQSYRRVGNLCSLSVDEIGLIWRFCIIYLPEWIFSIVSAGLLLKMYLFLRKRNNSPWKNLVFERGTIYSLIIFIPLTFKTCVRIIQAYENTCSIQYASDVSEVIFSLNGLFNSVAILLNKNVRLGLWEKYISNRKTVYESEIFFPLKSLFIE